jgi:hypothetical protein
MIDQAWQSEGMDWDADRCRFKAERQGHGRMRLPM